MADEILPGKVKFHGGEKSRFCANRITSPSEKNHPVRLASSTRGDKSRCTQTRNSETFGLVIFDSRPDSGVHDALITP